MTQCLVCGSPCVFFRSVDESDFFLCTGCGLIQLDSETIERIDSGELTFKYEKEYWGREMIAARERAFGVALARAAEVFFVAVARLIGSWISVAAPVYSSTQFRFIFHISPTVFTQLSGFPLLGIRSIQTTGSGA